MITWTCNNFKGHYPVGSALVVTADDVWTAIILVEKALKEAGLEQTIAPDQLIPMPTHHRYVRILVDGNY
jgi:hypothetical protein